MQGKGVYIVAQFTILLSLDVLSVVYQRFILLLVYPGQTILPHIFILPLSGSNEKSGKRTNMNVKRRKQAGAKVISS
jgi:hypothetical protein